MKKLLFVSIITSFIGIVIGARVFGNAQQTCFLDKTFNRMECCEHVTADGHCAVDQDVTVYNM